MKYCLFKINNLSGDGASIYTFHVEGDDVNLYQRFVRENMDEFRKEIININDRLLVMGNKTGAADHFFRLNEGSLGDGVCAIRDKTNLRLYVIRYGSCLVIIGSGGIKTVRALQDDEKLKSENYLLRRLSMQIDSKIRSGDLAFINSGFDFDGDLIFNDNDDDELC